MGGSLESQNLQDQFELFQRQYLQLLDLDKLALPPPDVIKRPDVQARIYNTMFRDGCLAYAPPDRYKLRVLKKLMANIEQAFEDPEEDVWFPCSLPSVLCHLHKSEYWSLH